MPLTGYAAVILPLHILGGILALAFGYFALAVAKGGTAHRAGGAVFGVAMFVMSLSGAAIAVSNDTPTSVAAGLMTFYMVATGWTAMRRDTSSWLDRAALAYAALVCLFCLTVAVRGMGSGQPEAGAMFIFVGVGVLAIAGDLRMMRGGLEGTRRVARHLWRMCFGLWVAAGSFFSIASRVPEVIRDPAMRTTAVLVPIIAMLYWLWRVRVRKSVRGLIIRATATSGVPS